jgi:glycosyltransferase involved in cell wall biosynthesis
MEVDAVSRAMPDNADATEPTSESSHSLTPADVAVIVPVGVGAPGWVRCAASLGRLDPSPGELVVVIDGDDPDLRATADEIATAVESMPERGGPARARNRAAELTDRAILFFVDSDVEVPPGTIATVATLFNSTPAPAAIIGSYDDAPGHPGFFSQYRNLLHHYVHQHGRADASTFWSGCGAMLRSAFVEVGGFDEGFVDPSIEDIELGSRLRRAGFTIRLVKELQVKHLKHWRLSGMLATDLWRRAVPWTELMLRDGQLVNDLNVKTRDRCSVALAFLLAALLAAAVVWPEALAIAGATMAALGGLNFGFFRFLASRRGIFFALAAMPVYWLYLLICGMGFAIGWLRHTVGGGR